METVTDKRGRTYERQRRPLSNTSINAMITLLGQILQQARRLRADRPQPRPRRRSLGAVPEAVASEAARSSRSTSSRRCSTPPASSRPRLAATSRASAGAR